MTVVFLQATISPLFELRDEAGRVVRTIAPKEAWLMYHADLAGLVAKVEQFEAEGTAEWEREAAAEPKSRRRKKKAA
jgi:hypothetical protein